MTKIRKGGYIFVTWIGDHPPRHVHVYRDGRLIVKWDLEHKMPITGRANQQILKHLRELEATGKL